METKLVRIAEISATSKHPIFTSVYHLINEDMLKQCYKELDGNKAVGIDKVTKDEYGKNLDRNIKELVQRLKNKSFKPLPSLRVYIPKGNGKKRPLGIASYEDKIVQMAVKKILGAIYEPRFLNCMYGFRPNRGCHEAIKEVYQRISYGKIMIQIFFTRSVQELKKRGCCLKCMKNPGSWMNWLMRQQKIPCLDRGSE